MHVLCLSGTRIILTNSEGGAGFDIIAAVRLELSYSEVLIGILVSVASLVALFVFSTRESEKQFETTITILQTVFRTCWSVAFLTLAFNSKRARETRIRRRESTQPLPNGTMPGRNRDDSGTQPGSAAATIITLPHTWSCVMISLSLLTYTAPQIVRFAFRFEKYRGALGSFSNLCFVAHLMMICNNQHSSQLSVAHLTVHIVGNACTFGSDSRNIGFSLGLALSYFILMGSAVLEFWLWNRVIRPMLASRNSKLLAKLPVTVFRWLFQRGGLTMGMYCYFEALGAGADLDRSSEDIQPWLHANNCIISQYTLSVVLSLTMLADARTSLSAVLRGRAPLHVTVGLALAICASLIVLMMFAGGKSFKRVIYNCKRVKC